jgi:glycosyltransferase involved in cell wall biosynthesis
MKVALVHDYIKEYGGAERVLETLHEMFPDAPVFTSVYLPNYLGPHKDRFKNWDIRPSILQWLPFKAKLISPLRLVAPFIFKQMNFDEFDVVIVSATGAYLPNSITKGKALHICYCHTPPRYLYGYPTARTVGPFLKPFVAVANHFLRMMDFNSAQNVDFFIANSKETAGRIEKFYRKDATVVYPPVDLPSSQELVVSSLDEKEKRPNYQLPSTNYYLAGGRLARAKRIDLAVKACAELGLPLKVFGKAFAGYGEELRNIANTTNPTNNTNAKKGTVEFVGEVTDQEKWELMANAKAFIFPAEFEDFGIVPVEAMAAGTPVITLRSGGVQETVVDGKTGVFFDESTVESLKQAVKKFEKMKFNLKTIRKQAEKFSKERFVKEIKSLIETASK